MRYVSRSNEDFASLIQDAKAYKAGNTISNPGRSMSAEFRRNDGYLPPVGYLGEEGRDSLKAWTKEQPDGAMVVFIYSYWTIVAALNVDTGEHWITTKKFSQTTGRHMSFIRYGIDMFHHRNA